MSGLMTVVILVQAIAVWMLCRERALRRAERDNFSVSYARLTEAYEQLARRCHGRWNGGITHRYQGLLQIESVLRRLPGDQEGVGNALMAVHDLQDYVDELADSVQGRFTQDESRFWQHLRQGQREGTVWDAC